MKFTLTISKFTDDITDTNKYFYVVVFFVVVVFVMFVFVAIVFDAVVFVVILFDVIIFVNAIIATQRAKRPVK